MDGMEMQSTTSAEQPEERCYYCASQSPGARSRVRAQTTPVRYSKAFQFLAVCVLLALVFVIVARITG